MDWTLLWDLTPRSLTTAYGPLLRFSGTTPLLRYLSIFMTSPDPGFNDIANRIFGHLDDSSFCACVRVCQLLYWYLEPEWQKRRHEKQVRHENQVRIRKELFEKVKPEFDHYLDKSCHLPEEDKVKEFFDKLLDPNITLDLSEPDINIDDLPFSRFRSNHNDDEGWKMFLSAVYEPDTKVLSFLLNHPNIKTITFGRKDDLGESWSTEILNVFSYLTRIDKLEMMLAHPKCQPFGYDTELDKNRIPFAFSSLLFGADLMSAKKKLLYDRVAKMILQYPKLGPVDFLKCQNCVSQHEILSRENSLHYAISSKNVAMVELILDHCPQSILTSETSYDRQSPLHLAIDRNHPDIVKLILDHRKFEPHFLVSLKMKDMKTPIQQAVEMNRLEIVKMILDHPKCDSYAVEYAEVEDEQMPSCSYEKIECEEIISSGILEKSHGIPMSEIIEDEENLNEQGRYDRDKKRKGKGKAKSSKKPRTG